MKTELTLSILLLTLIFSFEKGMAQAPTWAWAKSAGGPYNDFVNKITVDANGNSYITGFFSSATITFGNDTLINAKPFTLDFFLAKYDASGNKLWAKSAGDTLDDQGISLTVDGNGNVYVTGIFRSKSITFGNITLTNPSPGLNNDIFIVKYDSSGNVIWAIRQGNVFSNYAYAINLDAFGNIFVTGTFDGSLDLGGIVLTSTSWNNIFIEKLDSSANVIWAKKAGGTGTDVSYTSGLALDANGNSYLTGFFNGSSIAFDSIILFNTVTGYPSDIFIAKYDISGNLLWAKAAGGSNADRSSGIAVDANGNCYVTGYFDSPEIIFSSDTLINAYVANNISDILLFKLDSAGNYLWAKRAGGIQDDEGMDITLDPSGNLYMCGYFSDTIISFGSNILTSPGFKNIFIVKYDSSGNALWSTSGEGTIYSYGKSIGIDANNNLFLTGTFTDTLILGGNTLTSATSTQNEIYIAKLGFPTGIAEQNPINTLTLYPNPATDYLTINTNSNKKQVITISDITGKIIYAITTLSDKTIINTKDFPQGVYAAQVQAGDAVQTRKVVVTR